MISQLMDENGDIKHETVDLKKIATDYYTELFFEKKTSTWKSSKLLSNISKRLTQAQRVDMDKDLNLEELEKAVMKLQRGKSPGSDGIPAEYIFGLHQCCQVNIISKIQEHLYYNIDT